MLPALLIGWGSAASRSASLNLGRAAARNKELTGSRVGLELRHYAGLYQCQFFHLALGSGQESIAETKAPR